MRHGLLGAVHLPEAPDPVPDSVLKRLLPEEQAHASGLRGFRQVQWVGGRLAARAAVDSLGIAMGPLLSDSYGAPIAPKALTVSIAHKRHLAVAMVAQRRHGLIGVDLEVSGHSRMGIAPRVLTPDEMSEIQHLPPERQWTSVLMRFAIKEAIYKALAPRLQRYIGFEEAHVLPHTDGSVDVTLHLKEGDPTPLLEAEYTWVPQGLVATARARWQ
jgi:phosphopantetheine--protein transferase-like protein